MDYQNSYLILVAIILGETHGDYECIKMVILLTTCIWYYVVFNYVVLWYDL